MWTLARVPQPDNNQVYLFPERIAPRYQNSFPQAISQVTADTTNTKLDFIVQVIQDTWEILYLHKACLHSVMQEIAQAPEPEAMSAWNNRSQKDPLSSRQFPTAVF